jgi:hypothetical protein
MSATFITVQTTKKQMWKVEEELKAVRIRLLLPHETKKDRKVYGK